MSLVFRDTNLYTAAASVCGVTLEPTRPTPPSVCAPTDRTPPPVCGLPRPPTGPPLRSVGLRWALKPRTRPVHYKMTLVSHRAPRHHRRRLSVRRWREGTTPLDLPSGVPHSLSGVHIFYFLRAGTKKELYKRIGRAVYGSLATLARSNTTQTNKFPLKKENRQSKGGIEP